jgi:hypothetical protein
MAGRPIVFLLGLMSSSCLMPPTLETIVLFSDMETRFNIATREFRDLTPSVSLHAFRDPVRMSVLYHGFDPRRDKTAESILQACGVLNGVIADSVRHEHVRFALYLLGGYLNAAASGEADSGRFYERAREFVTSGAYNLSDLSMSWIKLFRLLSRLGLRERLVGFTDMALDFVKLSYTVQSFPGFSLADSWADHIRLMTIRLFTLVEDNWLHRLGYEEFSVKCRELHRALLDSGSAITRYGPDGVVAPALQRLGTAVDSFSVFASPSLALVRANIGVLLYMVDYSISWSHMHVAVEAVNSGIAALPMGMHKPEKYFSQLEYLRWMTSFPGPGRAVVIGGEDDTDDDEPDVGTSNVFYSDYFMLGAGGTGTPYMFRQYAVVHSVLSFIRTLNPGRTDHRVCVQLAKPVLLRQINFLVGHELKKRYWDRISELVVIAETHNDMFKALNSWYDIVALAEHEEAFLDLFETLLEIAETRADTFTPDLLSRVTGLANTVFPMLFCPSSSLDEIRTTTQSLLSVIVS